MGTLITSLTLAGGWLHYLLLWVVPQSGEHPGEWKLMTQAVSLRPMKKACHPVDSRALPA